MDAADRLSSLRFGVAELRRHPGDRMEIDRDVDLSGIEVSTARVPDDSPGHVTAVLESLSNGITVTATLKVPWEGPCRRCLDDTSGIAEVDIREVYSDSPVDDDLLALEGDVVDLGPVIRDAAVLALPVAPLCGDDCVGPDPEHFPVITSETEERPTDPRWSALDDLRFDQDPTIG